MNALDRYLEEEIGEHHEFDLLDDFNIYDVYLDDIVNNTAKAVKSLHNKVKMNVIKAAIIKKLKATTNYAALQNEAFNRRYGKHQTIFRKRAEQAIMQRDKEKIIQLGDKFAKAVASEIKKLPTNNFSKTRPNFGITKDIPTARNKFVSQINKAKAPEDYHRALANFLLL